MRSRASSMRPISAVENGKGEIAVQLRKAGLAYFAVKRQNDFGVAAGVETVAAGDQFFAQFHIIEDFAVEGDDDVAIFRLHGLGAIGKADDRQAHMGKARTEPGTGIRGNIGAAPIRTPMRDGVRHGLKKSFRLAHISQKTRKAAHAALPSLR